MNIPFLQTEITAEDSAQVAACLKSGWVSTAGGQNRDFEAALQKIVGCKHVLATASGTSALHLILLSLGMQPGDLILTSGISFVATANTITYCGAVPVFIDIDSATLNLDPESLRERLESLRRQKVRVKAVLLPHLLGHSTDMEAMTAICKEENLPLIEDAAQALGSRFGKFALGHWGLAGSLSFNGNKIITSGSGGAVLTDSEKLVNQLRVLAHQGREKRDEYNHLMIGYNYGMASLNASLGISQLGRLESIIKKKTQIHETYVQGFSGDERLRMVQPLAKNISNYWVNAVRLTKSTPTISDLREALKSRGIQSQRLYPPLHFHPPFQNLSTNIKLPSAEAAYERTLLLPSSMCMSAADQEQVIETVKSLL